MKPMHRLSSLIVGLYCITAVADSPLFTIKNYIYEGCARTYLASQDAGAGTYALTSWHNDVATGLAHEKITLNRIADQPNPFYNAAISHLTLYHKFPLVITKDTPILYGIASLATDKEPMRVLSSAPVADAQAATSAGIVGIAPFFEFHKNDTVTYYLLAVKSHDGVWGDNNAGLAVVKVHKTQEEGKEHEAMSVLDATTGAIDGNCAMGLGAIKEIIDYNGGLAEVVPHEELSLSWEPLFNRVFIPVHVKTKSTAASDQGACGLLIAQMQDDKLVLYPALDCSLMNSAMNGIIGAVGPNKEVYIRKLFSLYTSTDLPYLIVWGGAGDAQETAGKVYALPLVNASTIMPKRMLAHAYNHGAIAAQDSAIAVRYAGGVRGRFKDRQFINIPQEAEQLSQADNPACTVGAGYALPGPINDIITIKDCVYGIVSCNQEQHVYYSRPLFNTEGAIAAWTPWKRCGYEHTHVRGVSLFDRSPEPIFFSSSPETLWMQRVTHWQMAQNDESSYKTVQNFIEQEFSERAGGLQALQCYAGDTPGLGGQQPAALLALLGKGRCAFVCIGAAQEGVMRSTLGTQQEQYLLWHDDALRTVGHLTTSAVVHDDTQAWLAVGGVHGLAVCADIDGNGWSLSEGFMASSERYKNNQFVRVGTFEHIKELVVQGEQLFVLTRHALFRVHTHGSLEQWSIDCISKSDEHTGNFMQLIIHGPLAIIGTTQGIYRTVNTVDVRTANVAELCVVPVPRRVPWMVNQIYALSSARDDAHIDHRQLYVLGSSPLMQESFLFRLFVRDPRTYGVHDDTVSILQEYCCPHELTPYITFFEHRAHCVTNGIVHLSCTAKTNPLAHVLPSFITGKQLPSDRGYTPTLYWPSKPIAIHSIVENEVTGEWLMASTAGIAVYKT
ncbi:MAG: hypothetical protein WCE21_02200 [Candidatus Babeliales bacterium]